MRTIDINSDLGESFGNWSLGNDEAVIPEITSANVACGFHASDPVTMIRTVGLCKQHGVEVGSHPGLPDLLGFGRRPMRITPDDCYAYVLYQTGALQAVLAAEGLTLHHVKPHGAFYSILREDEPLAAAFCEAVLALMPEPVVYWPEGRDLALPRAARERGIRVVMEVYVDMDYAPDGAIVIQRHKGLTDLDKAAAQIRRFLEDGVVLDDRGRADPARGRVDLRARRRPERPRGDPGAAHDDRGVRPRRRAARRQRLRTLMRFGLMFSHQVPPGRGLGAHQPYEDMLRCLPRAEELGYDSAFQVSHHVQPDGLCPSPLIAMAGAAAVTERMRIGTGCLLVPLYAPLKLAEDVAVLDCLSNGRFVFGVAPGYVSEEFVAHGDPARGAPGALLGGARSAAGRLDAGDVLVRGALLPRARDERDAEAGAVAAARLVRPLGARSRWRAPPAGAVCSCPRRATGSPRSARTSTPGARRAERWTSCP